MELVELVLGVVLVACFTVTVNDFDMIVLPLLSLRLIVTLAVPAFFPVTFTDAELLPDDDNEVEPAETVQIFVSEEDHETDAILDPVKVAFMVDVLPADTVRLVDEKEAVVDIVLARLNVQICFLLVELYF